MEASSARVGEPLEVAPGATTPDTLAPDRSHSTLPNPQLSSTTPIFPEGGLRAWATVAGAYVFRLI
jgi:hypothetical protein